MDPGNSLSLLKKVVTPQIRFIKKREKAHKSTQCIQYNKRCSVVQGKVTKAWSLKKLPHISIKIYGSTKDLTKFLPFLQRFTAIQKMRPPPPNPQEVRAQIAASQQSSQQNRRLAQQMANRPAVRAALGTAPPRQQQQVHKILYFIHHTKCT